MIRIEIDRIKYHTIQDLLLDYDFIKQPTSKQIIFLDLIEAGCYYPYSTTQYWKFNSLYHIYKLLHPENYKNVFFYNNDIHLEHNHYQVKSYKKWPLQNLHHIGLTLRRSRWWWTCCLFFRSHTLL